MLKIPLTVIAVILDVIIMFFIFLATILVFENYIIRYYGEYESKNRMFGFTEFIWDEK